MEPFVSTAPAGGVLLLVAHPHLAGSRVNRALCEAARAVAGVTVHDLASAGAGGRFDVPAEQALLADHASLAFLHPLYWFAAPALLKAWQDEVLTAGFAHGPGGTALAGRTAIVAVTAGGREQEFSPAGRHGVTLAALLAPFERTLAYCGVRLLPPFAVFGGSKITDEELDDAAAAFGLLLARLRDGAAAAPPGANRGHIVPADLLAAD